MILLIIVADIEGILVPQEEWWRRHFQAWRISGSEHGTQMKLIEDDKGLK